VIPGPPPRPDLFGPPPDVPEAEPSQGGGPRCVARVTWGFFEAIGIYVLGNFLLGQILLVIVLVAIFGSDVEGSLSDLVNVAGTIGVDLVFLGFTVLWLNVRHKGWRAALGLPPAKGWRREIAWGVVAGAILYPAVAFVVGLLLLLLFRAIFGSDIEAPEQLPPDLSLTGKVLAAILAVVVAPLTEELYFRGVLFRGLRDRYGFWLGAGVSSLLFGAAHYVPAPWQDALLLQTVMIFTGLGLAWIHERRGTLAANVAAHMTFNVIGIALIFALA
jgi:uncharacterized protein